MVDGVGASGTRVANYLSPIDVLIRTNGSIRENKSGEEIIR